MEPNWLKWAKSLQAIAQTGLHYSQSNYDLERYQQIQEIASEIFAYYGNIDQEIILNLFSKQEGYATPKVDVRGLTLPALKG